MSSPQDRLRAMEPGCRAAGKGRAHSVRTGLSCQLGQLAPPEGLQAVGGASWPLVSFLAGLGGGSPWCLRSVLNPSCGNCLRRLAATGQNLARDSGDAKNGPTLG